MKQQRKKSLDEVLNQFKMYHQNYEHEEQLSQALVYLKLRQHSCDKRNSLIFAKKKQSTINGTTPKEGPPGFRKLVPIKETGKNSKDKKKQIKYQGAQGYIKQIDNMMTPQRTEISKFHKNQRVEEIKSKTSFKWFGLNNWPDSKQIQQSKKEVLKYEKQLKNPNQESRLHSPVSPSRASHKQNNSKITKVVPTYLEKVSLVREDIIKDKELRPLYVTFSGTKMAQTTKQYVKDLQQLNINGFVARLDVFNRLPNEEEQISIKVLPGQRKQPQLDLKRQKITLFRKTLRQWKSNDLNQKKQPNFQTKSQSVSNLSEKKLKSSSVTAKYNKNKDMKEFLDDNFKQDLQKIVKLITSNNLSNHKKNNQSEEQQNEKLQFLKDKLWVI